mgnify:FL=1
MKSLIIKILLVLASMALTVHASAQNLKESVTWEKIQESPAPLPVIGHLAHVESDLKADSFWSVGS